VCGHTFDHHHHSFVMNQEFYERTMNEHLVEVHDVIRSRIQDAFAKSWALLLSQRTPADMR
jgi:hypothetical protein